MSTTDNAFSETTLETIKMRADAIMFDDRIKQQYIPRVGNLPQAIARIQTANVEPLKSSAKDYTVDVEWFNTCDIAAEQCTTCDAGGNHGSTNIKNYAITQCSQVPFTVTHDTFATNRFGVEEATAKLMLTAEARLVEQVGQDYLTTIFANPGANAFNLDAEATVVGLETQVAAADYDIDFIAPHFTKVAQYNQFTNPCVISGNTLYTEYLNARYVQGTFWNVGDDTRFAELDWFWDIYNFNILGYTDYQFLVSTGATAFASRPMYSTTGIENWQQEGFRWSRPSRFMPGLWVDWTRQLDCYNDRLVENYKAKIRWEHLINPTGCTEDNTGILLYHQV